MNTHDIELPEHWQAFQRSKVWGDWEQVIPSAADDPGVVKAYTEDQVRAAIEADRKRRGEPPLQAIGNLLAEAMEAATANGADSRSMPDEYVEVAAWLCGVSPQPAEPVAMIRHFHYQGIVRSGLAQEAVMLDGAPTLPDGAMLYAAPQPAERSRSEPYAQLIVVDEDDVWPQLVYLKGVNLKPGLHDLFLSPQPAEPVKVLSDEELLALCRAAGFSFHHDKYTADSGFGLLSKAYTLEHFRALLDRYTTTKEQPWPDTP